MSGDNGDENTPRTLSGAPTTSSSWARPSDRPRVGRIGDWNNNSNNSGSSSRSGSSARIATFGSLGGGSSRPPPSSRRQDDDSDEDGDGEGENWFAGGERSGISVQNPGTGGGGPVAGGDIVRNLLRQAAAGGMAAPPQPQERPRAFFGGGHVLGSEDTESSFVPDPNAKPEEEDEVAIRHITLWRNGFQIGHDGELRTYDDPQNSALLQAINDGTAPLAILGVNPGQRVELRVEKKTSEDYTPPAGVRAFVGTGQRLGAPVPTFTSEGTSSAMPGGFPAAASGGSTERESVATKFEVDQSQPTTSIQIRLADGTRMVARMNLTHTVGDIRNFINASRPENLTRPYSVGTTFPNRTLDKNEETIEVAKLQNSVVVQRWV